MRFREDLYYRLCADVIRTPSLECQIQDAPAVFDDLLLYMVRRVVGEEAEACFPEIRKWIRENIPAGYPWPGNYRELEQCVRNFIIHGCYQPMAAGSTLDRIRMGSLTADEVLSWYTALVYRQTGTYEEAARRLGLDRRTVKAKVMQSPPEPAASAGE